MKFSKYVASVFAVLLISSALFAQKYTAENVESEEQYQQILQELTEKKQNLEQEKQQLQADIEALKQQKSNFQSEEQRMTELYRMVGASKAEVDQYRQKVGELTGKINRKEEPKEDRVAELHELQKNKISALPEFNQRVHQQLPKMLDAWKVEPKEVNYTVVKGDYLWKIAKMQQHYGNPFAWPKIFQANRDKIKDPDLIYPKQVFTIPNLTDEEKDKYDRLRKNYKPAPETDRSAD